MIISLQIMNLLFTMTDSLSRYLQIAHFFAEVVGRQMRTQKVQKMSGCGRIWMQPVFCTQVSTGGIVGNRKV